MLSLLKKTLVKEFYSQHAGLFLFLFYLIFGAVEPGQLLNYQKTLLLAVCASPQVLGITFFIWVLYTLKCVFFIKKQLVLDKFNFLQAITGAPVKTQMGLWAGSFSLMLAPVLFYGLLAVCAGISYGFYFSAIAIVFFLPVLIMAAAGYIGFKTTYAFRYGYRIDLPALNFSIPKLLWPVFYLLNRQKIMLLACKALSLLLIKAFFWMFADVSGDPRVAFFGLLGVILSHSVLISELTRHEVINFSFMKSLPVNRLRIFLNEGLVYLILLLPELVVISLGRPLSPAFMFKCMLFCTGGMFSLKMAFQWVKANMDRYLKFLLVFFVVASLSILWNAALAFSISILIFSAAYFYLTYYHTDLKIIKGKEEGLERINLLLME